MVQQKVNGVSNHKPVFNHYEWFKTSISIITLFLLLLMIYNPNYEHVFRSARSAGTRKSQADDVGLQVGAVTGPSRGPMNS